MITVVVGGPRGAGRTTTAIHIARLLRDHGQIVRFVGHPEAEKQIDDAPRALVLFGETREFEVIDYQGAPTHQLEEKLLALMKSSGSERKNPMRFLATLTELISLIDEAEDIDPTVFARFTADERKGLVSSALALALAGLANG